MFEALYSLSTIAELLIKGCRTGVQKMNLKLTYDTAIAQ